jgi:uncharacterized protein
VSSPVVYLDSSALVKLVVAETESVALRTYLVGGPPMATSRVALVEVSRSVRRRLGRTPPEVEQVFEAVEILELDARLAARAAAVMPAELRVLDSVHLASALEYGSDLAAFVCYDERLAAAAGAMGLQVVAPAS